MGKKQNLLECSSTLCKNMEDDMELLQVIEASLSWVLGVVGITLLVFVVSK